MAPTAGLQSEPEVKAEESPAYYLLDLAELPDELYEEKVPVEKWLERCDTADADGFAPGSLARLSKVAVPVELERLVGISLYLLLNLAPFVLPLVLVLLWRGWMIAKLLCAYLVVLVCCELLYRRLHPHPPPKSMREAQYYYTERNSQKYLSMRMLWPKSVQYPALDDKPVIFCMVPHGICPFGYTAYPLWSKLFNRRLNHPTAAPAVLKIPLVGNVLKRLGYIPAKSQVMKDVLMKKEESISVMLDGIAGMFQADDSVEKCWLQARKGICKVSLQTGCPIVPVYGFGHTSLYTIFVDPFGFLEWISVTLGVSVVPFVGRFGWPLGPPERVPVAVALGEPIACPKIDQPTDEQVAAHHAKMLEGFKDVFDTHKKAYGWGHKNIVFV